MTTNEEYLYRIEPTRRTMLTEGLTAKEERIVGEHFAYLQELTAQGVLILAGRTLTTDERGLGIVIFRAPSADAARAIMEGDPAVRQGVMRAELFPFRVALRGD